MASFNENTELKNKVISAAENSYCENSKELEKLEGHKLSEVAFLHGYNCAHSIYDVAEEKIDVLIKDGEVGEVPQKDYPTVSENGTDKARGYIKSNVSKICSMDNKSIYIDAYQNGFEEVWRGIPGNAENDEMSQIVDYYLKGIQSR